MQTSEIDPAALRRLSALHLDGAKVLSLYVNLDPREFATPSARETQITSLVDEADRRIREAELAHAERRALGEDLERAREFLRGRLPADGAHGLALFASGPAELFEVVKLPEPVPMSVCIGNSPWVTPLVGLTRAEQLCVALVNRRNARIFRGSREALTEVEKLRDDVHGRHDQGGWSQARYERHIDEEVADHLRHAATAVHSEYRARRFDRLLVGAPEELVAAFEQTLHPEPRERLVGRMRVDVEHSRPEDVLEAAREPLLAADRARERKVLDRLAEGIGRHSRAVAGLADVLGALDERRVEVLLYDEGFDAADVLESALEAAVLQSAETLVVRHHEDLGPLGGIGALLRF